jgi:hypothetical protein
MDSTTPDTPKKFFGFTPDLGGADDAALNAYYKQMKNGGARWVRFGVYWWFIERTPGTHTWYSTDRFFAAAACNGLAILPMFIGSPQWASGRSSTHAPPLEAHFPEFKAMIRDVVARYGEGGSYWAGNHHCVDGTPVPEAPAHLWEIWNEPNIMNYWGDQEATAQGYGRLLTAADEAINTSANPKAPTVMGGLTGSKVQVSDFLTALYAAVPDLNEHVDVFDLHAYAMTPQASLELLRSLRQTADAHGATRKPIWVSEVAWSSCLQAEVLYPSRCVNNPLAHDEAEQRTYLKDMYSLLLAHASELNLRRVAWYSLRDPSATRGTCNFCYGSGLRHRDGSPKPAWHAYVGLSGEQP